MLKLSRIAIVIVMLFSGVWALAQNVTSVASTPSGEAYRSGESLTITITFSEPIDFAPGTGHLELALNSSGAAVAILNSAVSNSSTLTLTYAVSPGENANPLNYASTAALTLTGTAAVKKTGELDDADLTLPPTGSASALANSNITIDTTPPGISIGAPSASATTAGPVTFTITYSGASNSSLTPAGISLNATGSATGSIQVTDVTATGATVTISAISGTGTLGISVVAGSASDAAGNLAPASGPSSTFTVDNEPPAAFVTGAVTVNTGGTMVAGFFNSTNSNGISIAVPIANDNSLLNGNVQVQVSNDGPAGDFINLLTTAVNIAAISTTQNVNVAQTLFTTNSKFVEGGTLHFRAIITDALGNSTTGGVSATTIVIDRIAPTFTIGSPSLTVAGSSSTVVYPVTYTGADNVTLAASDITKNLTGTADGSVTINSISASQKQIEIGSLTGNGTFGVTISAGTATDAAGNSAAASLPSSTFSIDTSFPVVNNIAVGPDAPLKGFGSVNSTAASSLPFTITFSESVVGVDASDFSLQVSGTIAPAPAYTFNVTGSGNSRVVSLSGFTGTGTIRLIFNDDNSVTDQIGNTISNTVNTDGDGTFTTGPFYSVVLPSPSNQVSGFAATNPTINSIELSWSNPSSPASPATHYLIRARGANCAESASTFPAIADGTAVPDDTDFSDGFGAINLPASATGYIFNTLLSGRIYDFEIVPYTRVGTTDIDYLLTGVPTTQAVTTVSNGGTITAGSTNAPTTISSLSTSFTDKNFTFKLADDNSDLCAKTRISSLVIRAGADNTVTNWADVIAQAELRTISEARTVTTTNIGASSITFTLSFGDNEEGELDEGEEKEYELRIRLRSPLQNNANLTIDGRRFVFALDEADITYASAGTVSSRFAPGASEESDPSRNQVTVVATQFTFNPAFGGIQPPPSALVKASLGGTPTARAVDANGNTDLDYNSVVTVGNNGSLSQSITSANASSGVISIDPTLQYNAAGDGTLVLTQGPVSGLSSSVTVAYAGTSTIAPSGALSEPFEISSLVNASPGVSVFDFTIRDDGGAGGDGENLLFNQLSISRPASDEIGNWLNAIAGATLNVDGTVVTGTVSANTITFNVTHTLPTDPGYIADNASKTYELKIWLRSALGGSLPTTIDKSRFIFEVTESNISILANSSNFSAGGVQGTNSGSTSNAVDVDADRLVMVTQPQANVFVLTNFSTPPVAEARDSNGNRDRDYGTSVTVSNTGSIPMDNLLPLNTITPVEGVITFPSNFQYRNSGNGTLTLSSGSLTSTSTNNVDVRYADNNRINAGTLTEPATISSIANVAPGTPVFDFVILDDNGTGGDGSPTRLQGITITQGSNNQLSDWTAVIAGATLTAGGTTVTGVVTMSSIQFSGLANSVAGDFGYVQDNQPKTFTLNIWLNPNLPPALSTTIDGMRFDFEITENNIALVTSGTPSSSTFEAPGNQTQRSGASANAVAVVATQLDFTSIPASSSINVNFGPVVVEARDVNGNRDLDFVAAVNPDVSGTANDGFSNSRGLTVVNDPMSLGQSFNLPSPGVLTFASNFQFTSAPDPPNPPAVLTIRAGSLSGTSSSVGVVSSTESTLAFVNADFLDRIPYINFQSGSISSQANSFPLATLRLTDGNGVVNDADGAPTTISMISFEFTTTDDGGVSVAGAPAIRQIALYNASGIELAEQALGGNTAVTFNISPANYITANDNTATNFTLRATFQDTSSTVRDLDNIQVRVTNVTHGPGSEFNPSIASVTDGTWSKASGNVSGAAYTPDDKNIADVVATQLIFTQQPPAFAGINEPVPLSGTSAQVRALDAFSLIDLEFDHATYGTVGNLASAATLTTSTFEFSEGVLELPSSSLKYSGVGLGTLTISASSLPPTASSPSVAVSSRVDVIHVQGNNAPAGIVSTQSLPGGAVDRVLYGVTFNAAYTVTGEPKLSEFTISFSNPFRDVSAGTEVLKNFRVFETTGTTYVTGLPQIVTNGGSITPVGNDKLRINFSPPRDLNITPTWSFFLMADVDATANGSTPPINISVEDGGDGSSTNGNIVTTRGSATASAIGLNTYSFAAIFPPSLASTVPASGQLNVATDQPTIELFFSVPVTSLDGKVVLTDQANDTSIELNAANGTGGSLANPLVFNIPSAHLQPDKVYYVTIAPGNLVNNTGIRDQAGNLFPGISFSGTLYFKTARVEPPQLLTVPEALVAPSVTALTTNTALISATFDIAGRAYFTVLPKDATAPVNALAVKNGTVPGTVTAGSFDVVQTRSITQSAVISGLAAGTAYDVWVVAESYAFNSTLPLPSVTPILVAQPYGSAASNFAVGGAGPTFTFTTPNTSPAVIQLNNPAYAICTNSFQTLNVPIVISEASSGDFRAAVANQVQTLSMILPAGFQFDVSQNPDGTPKYGKLILDGADFNASQPTTAITFFGANVLQINYRNDGNGSLDNIIISGLRVLASSVTSGRLLRLGGNALTASIPDLDITRSFAQFSSGNANGVNFDNAYSRSIGKLPSEVVTTIPDNFNEPSRQVELIPLPPPGDFGASSFSGPGVNVNQLSLSAVTLGIPFNVIHTYTDNNGCVSSNAIQYTVYDHNTAIRGLETQYCSVNTNFEVNEINRPDMNRPEAVHTVSYDNLSAYYMLDMSATIPNSVTPGSQIIFGPAWESIVNTLPVRQLPGINPPNNPLPGSSSPPVDPTLYFNYTFDEAVILDANHLSGGVLDDPYSHFKVGPTAQGNFYYSGGSLGIVEFNANFQSIANAVLQIPLRQNVEFFLPAVPIVEVGQSNQSSLDINDPLNQVGSSGPSNKGTPVFCEQGGPIVINGFPAASAGSSTGRFTIQDVETGTPIVTAALIDNGNGTATLNPVAFSNGYKNIRIIYTYKALGSPCESSGSQVIRISPNPVASYSQTTLCEDIAVMFTDQSSLATAPGVTITNWAWSFGDPNSGEANTSTDQNPNHIYANEGTYSNVSLQVTTSAGCSSTLPAVKELKIGSTPIVNFEFAGVDVSQDIIFTDNSRIPSAASNIDDGFKEMQWTFGDAIPTATTTFSPFIPGERLLSPNNRFTYQYAQPGQYTVNLQVISQIGCVSNIEKNITVLPRATVTDLNVYLENFETNDGGWEVLNDLSSTAPPTWQHGLPTKNVIAVTADQGQRVWTTNLNGNYNTRERSYLYSPSFDITALERPMISFDAFIQMEASDGVVLEYSTDNKNINDATKSWVRLGEIVNGLATGSQWYNTVGLAAKPGNQVSGDLGWSGNSISNWISPRHALDAVGAANRERVVFRFALASVKDPVILEGFALDNVRIGNRTRTILLESFTSTNGLSAPLNSTIKSENDFIRNFNATGIGTTLVNLKYHIGFLGQDPFNLDNQAVPSSRALYYNITQIPAARLDGLPSDVPSEQLFSTWGQRRYDVQTLQLAQANIELTVTPQDDGGIALQVKVTPRIDLPSSTVLQIAITERSIPLSSLSTEQQKLVSTNETQFDFIVRDMLPDAVGRIPSTPFVKDVPYTFETIVWYPDLSRLFAPADDIAFVAFLQDKDSPTKEVFQVDYFDGFVMPSIVTTAYDYHTGNSVKLFPNPAHSELTVHLSEPATNDVGLAILDLAGKLVLQDKIAAGLTEKTIGVVDLKPGVYLLQLQEKGVFRTHKFTIIH